MKQENKQLSEFLFTELYEELITRRLLQFLDHGDITDDQARLFNGYNSVMETMREALDDHLLNNI